MKTVIFNTQAIKKANGKAQLMYYRCGDDTGIVWSTVGHFAIMTKQFIIDEEIKKNLPTIETTELPVGIKNVFVDTEWETVPEIRNTHILYNDPACKIVNVFYNPDNNYLTAINPDYLKMIKFIENYTIRQQSVKSPIMFKWNTIRIVIMPVYIRELKQNIIDRIGK